MAYTLLKTLHLTTVAITLSLFLLRGAWRLMDSTRLNQKWVKVVPHANDAILLASAIGMIIIAKLNPLQHGWLMAKIIALLAYIVLGTIALKRGKTPLQRNLAFIGALAVFGYMLAVAVSKQVWPV
ncbi:MAG: SirB2 family protein [Hydrogenophilaceae bacterium]|nr:SirB2 family protein [Hydrogenophilaceae bacterium]